MEKNDKIFIAGHEGMIGSAILRRLEESGFNKLVTKTSAELDLTDQTRVAGFFTTERPEYVFLAVTRLGGIMANTRFPADFIYTNLTSQTSVIHAAYKHGVKKLLFLASSCIYPGECPQPMKEEYLLTGKPEPSSEAYAVAKIAGIKMCQAYNRQYGTKYLPVVPADVYGPGDDFNTETGHVLPSLMAKIHRAKTNNEPEVAVWGTGSPRRECLYVDDLADACILLMNRDVDYDPINIGSGEDITIKEMAQTIKEIAGYKGSLVFDASKPDGAPQKLLDISRIKKLGWQPETGRREGIKQTYEWYQAHIASTHSGEM